MTTRRRKKHRPSGVAQRAAIVQRVGRGWADGLWERAAWGNLCRLFLGVSDFAWDHSPQRRVLGRRKELRHHALLLGQGAASHFFRRFSRSDPVRVFSERRETLLGRCLAFMG